MKLSENIADWIIREASKCVYCGFCEPVCPTIYPGGHRGYGPRGRVNLAIAIINGARSTEIENAIYTCLLCGACSLVCPAKIDIVNVIRSVKLTISHPRKSL